MATPPVPEVVNEPPPPITNNEVAKAKTVLDILEGSGQFILMFLIALGVLWLLYKVGQLIEKFDVTKLDPTQFLTLVVGQSLTILGMAAAFYFGKQAQATTQS